MDTIEVQKQFKPPQLTPNLVQLDRSFYVYTIILALASILVTGYSIYIENHALQIPLIHWLNNNSLYPHDPFAETLRYYASILWYLVAFVNRFIPLEPLLFTLFIIERLLVIGAAGYLAKTFAPQSKLAMIGSMCLFALGLRGPTLGGNELVINYFEQTGLSIPFFLLAFAAFYQQKPWQVAIWTAIGFNFNSMFGVYALTYLGAVFVLEPSYQQNWQKWLLAFGLFLLLASPAILLTISAFGRKATDQELWYIASQIRFPHHLSPLTWQKIEYGKYLVLIVLLLGFLWQNKTEFKQLLKACSIWAGVSLLWLGYAFFAAYIAKSSSMLVMHPGRGLTLWYGLASVALLSVCATKLEATKGIQRRSFFFALFCANFILWHPMVGPYILAVSLLGLGLQPVWYYLLKQGNSQRIALLLTIGIISIGLINFQSRWVKTGSFTQALASRPPFIIEEIAIWAKEKTSLDSVFLVDFNLGWQQFRALSKRPVFMNWKDGAAILWDRPFIQPWSERLQTIGFDFRDPKLNLGKAYSYIQQRFKNLTDAEVRELNYRYRLNYWVIPINKQSQFPVVFKNQDFKVVKLNINK